MTKLLLVSMISGAVLATGVAIAQDVAVDQDHPPAQDEQRGAGQTKINAELELGLEYNSSLAVEELDRSTSQSDTAAVLRAKLDGEWQATDRFTLRGGYSYLGKYYRDLDEYDLTIHQLFADAGYDFDVVTLGVSHFLAMAELDGDDFMDLNQTSLYASRLFDNHVFVRIAADYREKDFDGRPDRDATSKGLGGDVYFFYNNARTYFTVGAGAERENANGPELDFDGLALRTRFSHRFHFMDRENQFAAAYRYADRDYSNIDPLIGAKRRDKRHSARLEWTMGVMRHLDLVSTLEYRNYNSNLETIDYSETLAALALRLKL